jgi:hypothetical protein
MRLPVVFINYGFWLFMASHSEPIRRLSIMDKEFNYPRDFKGVWIPKQVFLDERLNAIEKLILAEVDSLDVEGSEGCFASNEYLAKFCQCSVTKVSTSVSKLIKLGYLYVLKNDGRKRYLKSRLSNFESQEFKNSNSDTPNMKHSNNSYKYSVDDTDKDFILPNKEKKTLPKNGKGSKTSAPNNINILDINNIPSRTTEQKEVYRKQKQKNRSEKYRDEDVPQILYNEFDSLYGEQGNVLEDHDICLTMAVIAYYFKQYREHMGEQHIMISTKYANQFMGVIIGDDSPLLKADVEEKDELRFYQDMIDEFFKSDLGQRNGKDFDRHIWLFFTEENQRILCERVKQKWDNQEYID